MSYKNRRVTLPEAGTDTGDGDCRCGLCEKAEERWLSLLVDIDSSNRDPSMFFVLMVSWMKFVVGVDILERGVACSGLLKCGL